MLLDPIYAEVVHWRRNWFSVLFGKTGKDLVREPQHLKTNFESCHNSSYLLLQKPSNRSKTKDHIKCLERRLADWSNGDLEELVKEGRSLQHRLPRNRSARPNINLTWSFAKLTFMGRCKAALDLISNMPE